MYNYFLSPSKKKQYILLIVDILVILISIGFSYVIRFLIHQESISIDNIIVRLDVRHAVLIVTYTFSLYIFSQYNLNQIADVSNFPKILIMALTMGVVVTSSVFFFFPKYVFGRTVLLSHYLLLLVLIGAWRIAFVKFVLRSGTARRVLVLGERGQVDSFLQDIKQHANSGYEIIGAYYREEDGFRSSLDGSDGAQTDIGDVLISENFDLLIYDTKCRCFDTVDIETILQSKYKGKAIYDIPTFYQDVIGKAPIEFIDNVWLLFNTQLQGREKQYYVRVKRLLDLGLALFLLTLLAPLILLIGVAIKMTSKGPALFRQERLCAQQGTFSCIKFRTMHEVPETDQERQAWATAETVRITRLGKFLRATRLDEILQLWNILKGEMSFVGPRPIRKHFADKMAKSIPFYNLRFMVKPGLSGWAQVNLGYADSTERQHEKFKYELFYLQNMSFLLDLIIILKTMQKMIKGDGR